MENVNISDFSIDRTISDTQNVKMSSVVGHKKYTCTQCKDYFASKKQFHSHILQIHAIKTQEDNMIECTLCSSKLEQKKIFYRHFRRIHSKKHERSLNNESIETDGRKNLEGFIIKQRIYENKVICAHCDNEFNTKHALSIHLKSEHMYPCTLCKKSFKKYRYYKLHLLSIQHRNKMGDSEKNSEMLQCEECYTMHPHRTALTTHMKRVHRSKNNEFACPLCPFKAALQGNLNRHVKLHTNDRACVCEQCGSCFNSISGLKEHIAHKHTEERNFSCEICGTRFKLKNGLNRHMKTHSEERNEKCFCGSSYKLASNLTKHQASAHGIIRNKRVVQKIKEGEGYVMNSPNVIKVQNQIQRNIDDLEIQPLSILSDVDFSDDMLNKLNDNYDFYQNTNPGGNTDSLLISSIESSLGISSFDQQSLGATNGFCASTSYLQVPSSVTDSVAMPILQDVLQEDLNHVLQL